MLLTVLAYRVNHAYDAKLIGLDDACSLLYCLRRWEFVAETVKLAVTSTIDTLPKLDDVSTAVAMGLADRI